MSTKSTEPSIPKSITNFQEELKKYQQALIDSQKNTLRLEGVVAYISQLIKEEEDGK